MLALCPGATRTNFFERAQMTGVNALTMASPDEVARQGLAALGRRTVHVVGGVNRLATWSTRLVPRSMLLSGSRNQTKRLARKG